MTKRVDLEDDINAEIDAELGLVDYMEDEPDVPEEAPVEEPVKKKKAKSKAKSKKQKNKTTKVEKESGEIIQAEVQTTEDGLLILDDEAEFDPQADGQRSRELLTEITQAFFDRLPSLARILERASKHYKRQKNEFEKWTRKYVKIGYSTARQYMTLGLMAEETLKQAKELGFTAPHMMSLLGIASGKAKEPAMIEFMEKEEHPIDDEGRTKATSEMTPKDISAAVKQIKKSRGEKCREVGPDVKMKRCVQKVEGWIDSNWEVFKESLKTSGVKEIDEETITSLKRVVKNLELLSKRFNKLHDKYC